MCGSAEGSTCRPKKCWGITLPHTLPSNHQCNFSTTNISFQTFLLHFFYHWRQWYDLSISVKLADLISVPEQCQRHTSCSPLFTSSLLDRDCLDGLLLGLRDPGEKYFSRCNFKEEIATVFSVPSHENLHMNIIYQKQYLLLCTQATDHTSLITIIIL